MVEMYAVITQNGKEIFKVEKSMENEGEESMKTMVTHIREVQVALTTRMRTKKLKKVMMKTMSQKINFQGSSSSSYF